MRRAPISPATVCALVVGWAVPLTAQPGPCAQITAVCTSAGFTQGGVGSGTGLQVDCVVPIMQGMAQPAAATRPLPHVDPQLIAACKASHPDFGRPATIEINSFSFGATNPASTSPSKTTKAGSDSAVINQIDSGIGHRPTNPIYKGPNLIVPPSGGQPNDSAHKRPPH
jgi:hypothetical protein